MSKPFVILKAAMSVDGKIASIGGDSKLSCEEDLRRLHYLRSQVDAVMVGVGTILKDDPSLTVRLVRGRNPIRVVVDSQASTPPTAKVLDQKALTIIAVSRKAPKKRLERLKERGAKIIVAGKKQVNLKVLLNRLCQMGIKKLLVEGGSTLNWSLIKEHLVDELQVSVCPFILGGEKAKTLVGGKGFRRIAESLKLKLVRVGRVGEDIILVYRPLATKQ